MPPHILQIHREPIKAGREPEYAAVENETCRLCAELGCPHPFLGAESFTGSTEVWFFNGYTSWAEQQRVIADYARNVRLMDMLTEQSERKSRLTEPPVEVFATYRSDESRGTAWSLGRGRFLIITVTKHPSNVPGTVFEATDGTRFVFSAANDRNEADRLAVGAGSGTVVCAVRPSWSSPAPEWIAADPAFWRPSTLRP